MVNVHCATSACVIWFISMPELPRVAVLLSKRLPTCDTWRQSFCQMLAPFCATFSLKYDVLVTPAQKHNATCQQGEFAEKKTASSFSAIFPYTLQEAFSAPICLDSFWHHMTETGRYVRRSGYPKMAWMPIMLLPLQSPPQSACMQGVR